MAEVDGVVGDAGFLGGLAEGGGDGVLVLVAGAEPRSILFCRPKNEEREIWDGWRIGPDAARERFGVDEAWPIEALARGVGSKVANASSGLTPSSCSIKVRTVAGGMGGAASCSFDSSRR